MNLVPLSQLCAGLANPPHRNDEDGLNAYRVLCGRVYFAALQAVTSGNYPSNTLTGFPSIRHEAFALMDWDESCDWADLFSKWVGFLPRGDRERLLAGYTAPV